MIDLHKLQIFTIVAREGSFSAAAEQLYITQSAVSQHMKELEASLGRQLFHRRRRGVALTPHGEILLGHARQIFALVASAENALADVAHLTEGRVNMGTTPGVAVYLAPEWIGRFRERYPNLTVAMQTGVTAQIISGVLGGRLDLGIVEGEVDAFRGEARLAWREIATIEQFVIVGRDHSWAGRAAVRLEELHGQPLIVRQAGSQTRAWLESELRPRGIAPVVATELDNLESMKRSAAQGRCLTILPRYVVEAETAADSLRAIPIEGRPLERTLKLVWAADGYLGPVTRAFLEALEPEYPALRAILDNS